MFGVSKTSSLDDDLLTNGNLVQNTSFNLEAQRYEKITSSNFTDDGSKKRTSSAAQLMNNSKAMLDPGYRPTTIRMLQLAIEKPFLYQDYVVDKSPYSLVGWPIPKTTSFALGECRFELSDGTGSALILMDLRSYNESWLSSKLKKLLCTNLEMEPATNENEKPCFYVRVIATLSSDKTDSCITMRAFHVSPALYEDVSFLHTLSCVYVLLEPYEDEKTFDNKEEELPHGKNFLDSIQLPESHQWCTNPCEVQILKFLMINRIPMEGVAEEKIYEHLASIGFTDKTLIKTAIQELLDATLCLKTKPNWIDILLDEE